MSKTKKTPKQNGAAKKNGAAKPTQRWSLGLFASAKNGGDPRVVYVTKAGKPAPYQAKAVKGKAIAHNVFVGVSYAQARAQLLKAAGIKEKAPADKK
jgi:hypothetical protein